VLIDHLVYAVPSLPAGIADVAERFGVRARAGGKHVGLGTHNALPLLAALGADIEIKRVPAAALVARLSGPNGRTVLR
jgi:hypothetical protein